MLHDIPFLPVARLVLAVVILAGRSVLVAHRVRLRGRARRSGGGSDTVVSATARVVVRAAQTTAAALTVLEWLGRSGLL